jgi:hypothetical protein
MFHVKPSPEEMAFKVKGRGCSVMGTNLSHIHSHCSTWNPWGRIQYGCAAAGPSDCDNAFTHNFVAPLKFMN